MYKIFLKKNSFLLLIFFYKKIPKYNSSLNESRAEWGYPNPTGIPEPRWVWVWGFSFHPRWELGRVWGYPNFMDLGLGRAKSVPAPPHWHKVITALKNYWLKNIKYHAWGLWFCWASHTPTYARVFCSDYLEWQASADQKFPLEF
jgi:hypothetical protein